MKKSQSTVATNHFENLPEMAVEYAAWDTCYKEGDTPFKWGALPETATLVEMFKAKKAKRILDAACGDGGQMLPLLDEFLVVGADQSSQALAAAKRNLLAKGKSNFILIQSFIETMTFTETMFDAIVLKDVFMMFRKPELVLAHLRSLLDSNGTLVLSTFSTKDVKQYQAMPNVSWITSNECVYGQHFYTRFYTKSELEQLLLQCGYRVVIIKETTHDDQAHQNFRNTAHAHYRLMLIAERK